MEIRRFKTDMGCGSNLTYFGEVLKKDSRIISWELEHDTWGKLRIISENMSVQEIIELIRKAGYIAYEIKY